MIEYQCNPKNVLFSEVIDIDFQVLKVLKDGTLKVSWGAPRGSHNSIEVVPIWVPTTLLII